MQRYYFDLIDSDKVRDVNGGILIDDEQAKKVAHDLAQEVREGRPELIDKGFAILVTNDIGDEISRVPIDRKGRDGG